MSGNTKQRTLTFGKMADAMLTGAFQYKRSLLCLPFRPMVQQRGAISDLWPVMPACICAFNTHTQRDNHFHKHGHLFNIYNSEEEKRMLMSI